MFFANLFKAFHGSIFKAQALFNLWAMNNFKATMNKQTHSPRMFNHWSSSAVCRQSHNPAVSVCWSSVVGTEKVCASASLRRWCSIRTHHFLPRIPNPVYRHSFTAFLCFASEWSHFSNPSPQHKLNVSLQKITLQSSLFPSHFILKSFF